MKSLIAFTKKEMLSHFRSFKLPVLASVFVLVAVMNVLTAKFTPWLLEIMSESLELSGMVISEVSAKAIDSWVQFFKNLPMCLIAFVIIESNIFTKEYRSGTLIMSLTKGMQRYKVVLSKLIVLVGFWTVGFWVNFGITYGLTEVLWDDTAVKNVLFAALLQWIFGLWVTSLIVIFSTFAKSNVVVLAGGAGEIFAIYLISMLPKIKEYLPTFLTDGNSLIYGISKPEEYIPVIIITVALTVFCAVLSFLLFNKKQL